MNVFTGRTSRRRLLAGAGAIGAAGAAGTLAQAMAGLVPAEAAPPWHGKQQLPPGIGKGKKVLILGAGIAGLTAAYELNRAGYEVTVLEAQKRAGGRSLTARRGDVVAEYGEGGGLVEQECKFDDGLYLNLGPGRLPYHHRRVLRYCEELGVALEPYVKETTANLFQTEQAFGALPVQNRQVANDTRGWIADLLSQAIKNNALDSRLPTQDERDRALSLLREFGRLDESGAYHGSDRSGCAGPLEIAEFCEHVKPLPLAELLGSRFWEHRFYQPIELLWQPTMFQPVGGMDMIVKGFLRRVGKLIRYGAVVSGIEVGDESVKVTWQEGGSETTQEADYCLSNIPLPILKDIPANFSPAYDEAVNFVEFDPACKVGWQANKRFWEDDKNQIYGGISFIDHNITQVWYPSYDYFSQKGTMTGAYNYRDSALELGEMAPLNRLKLAKSGAALLHKEFLDEAVVPIELGLSIAWHKVPYQAGGWAHWEDTEEYREMFARLLVPDRRFHVIGDQISPLDGWQEGAMMSAENAVNQVAGLVPVTESAVAHAPDSVRLTEG